MSETQPRTCTGCNGNGGETTTAPGTNGAQITTWRACHACSGTGVQGGGI
jgi:DnaJ-class molecular chaperone